MSFEGGIRVGPKSPSKQIQFYSDLFAGPSWKISTKTTTNFSATQSPDLTLILMLILTLIFIINSCFFDDFTRIGAFRSAIIYNFQVSLGAQIPLLISNALGHVEFTCFIIVLRQFYFYL